MTSDKSLDNLMLVIWTIALLATGGSLFYSEVMGFTPCELCWVQRIFMYPLIMIYGVALWKKNIQIALPGLFLSGIGFLISSYHYLLQKLPLLQEVGDTCGIIPCHTQYVNYLGFITIPFQAGISFLSIFVLHLLILKLVKR
ncbi:disulfide bond formation protein DsbB [Cerasibacillus quisquiliarum]|uniref:Probable disulfide formation protein n=1 Tax=Cerasibacillus quisquiliarum TaxID=227865 RepID=A0A511UVV5_9BACI|nr:disulfide oxidoreductase [Cerasibacillus quisquiliarum]MBB5146390.1 disulfide bond formation protein DsbB [Cerasibacillus quisquiliarum]GEN30717.1 putative disulfide formation protein C [Cerasibacillus quisquiliarum]